MKPKRTDGDEICGEVLHSRTISDNRPDMMYAAVVVKDQELKAVIDCGSTVTIIREDLAESLRLKIDKYNGNRVNAVNGAKVIPTGKTYIKLVIEDSFGHKADVHTDSCMQTMSC